MDTLFFENLLSQNLYGFAYLSPECRVVTANKRFARFTVSTGDVQRQSITQLFPETFGLEAILSAIIDGSQPTFSLENINRETEDGEINYFNISFHPTDDADKPLFCLITDVTDKATLQQQVNQQRNEIQLLEGILKAQSSEGFAHIWGDSEPISKVKRTIEKIAKIPTATILLTGESGTGKSMIARIIHYSSQGSQAPFVEINCAAIPDTLLESELFGYEKGAFTNAMTTKPGLLETAHNGTLFLDEIGEMPPKLQAKLLSFLETRRFRRLGSNKEISVDIRLITATNRHLKKLVHEQAFREDLFYRLSVVNIDLPSLRVMGDDILTLASNFVNGLNISYKKSVKGFTSEARNKLRNHEWPGNVRELRNAIERAMIFVEGDAIDAEDLQIGMLSSSEPSASPLERFKLPPEGISFDEIEKKLLQDAMAIADGNQSRAAKLLHLSRDTFRYRLEKYHLI